MGEMRKEKWGGRWRKGGGGEKEEAEKGREEVKGGGGEREEVERGEGSKFLVVMVSQ